MREPPTGLSQTRLTALLCRHWGVDITSLAHLPWGFGGWHWSAKDTAGQDRWFVTADRVDRPGRLGELRAALTAAAALHRALPQIVPTLPAGTGERVVEDRGFGLSLTTWHQSAGPDPADDWLGPTVDFLRVLHSVSGLGSLAPIWQPTLRHDTVLAGLDLMVRTPWMAGPLGEQARSAVLPRLGEILSWRKRHATVAKHALSRKAEWVLTHGEPGPHNQLCTIAARRWVDWESLRVAPRERDLSVLMQADQPWQQRYGAAPDPVLLELFDLEWRLNEIGEYAARFAAPHVGAADDRVALGGLLEELSRADLPR